MSAPYPTESWSDDQCGMAVVYMHAMIGREACIRISCMAIEMMDHAKVMAYFDAAALPPADALALAQSVEAYLRETKRRRSMS